MRIRPRNFNILATILATSLFGVGVLTSTPESLRSNVIDVLGAVGVSIAVSPNPYNTVAQQLSNKEALLDAREAALAAQEKEAAQESVAGNTWGFFSLCLSAVLFVLVGINFYLDSRRRTWAETPQKLSLDLR